MNYFSYELRTSTHFYFGIFLELILAVHSPFVMHKLRICSGLLTSFRYPMAGASYRRSSPDYSSNTIRGNLSAVLFINFSWLLVFKSQHYNAIVCECG